MAQEELKVDPIITKLLKLVEEKDKSFLELKSRIDAVRMAQDLKVDPIMTKLIKINEEKDKAILELKGRIDGVGTKLQYLLERLNISVVDSRISSVNHNFNAYEIKLDKLVRRIDILEQNLNQYFRNK